MAKIKTNKVLDAQALKNMPSDQLTEVIEVILVAIVNNSKLKESFKAILVQLIKEIENQINPDGTTTVPIPTPKKNFWKTVLSVVTFIGPFILKFFTKKK